MNRKVNLNNLNPHLMCVLCGGYYIDATTIVECLHSFCKSCIVKHLESSKYCPICDVQIHKTKPLLNIKQDSILQDIVYKLVPGLFQGEMQNRRKFYKDHPHYIKPNDSEQSGEIYTDSYHSHSTDTICISLSYHNITDTKMTESQRRFLRCPSGVTVHHLQKLIEAKYGLDTRLHSVDILYEGQQLNKEFSLLEISYIYLCNKKRMLDLTYRINRYKVRKRKLEDDDGTGKKQEEGVANREQVKTEGVVVKEEKEEKKDKTVESVVDNVDKVKGEDVDKCKEEVAGKDNSVEKEIQLQITENGDMLVSQVNLGGLTVSATPAVVTTPAVSTAPGTTPAVSTAPAVVTTPAVVTSSAVVTTPVVTTTTKTTPTAQVQPPVPVRTPPKDKSQQKPNNGKQKTYKTVTKAPNCWHPVIPREKLRPTLLKSSIAEDQQPKKPLKFFKMRNMPRFLGNPASGVKPMFAEGEKIEKQTDKNNILRIDPKTLRPIEKKQDLIQKQNNLLTSPFIPNNHFLFSDVQHLPPSTQTKEKTSTSTKELFNGTSLPHNDCFKFPQNPGFFPVNDAKFNPLFRAASMSPFTNYNLAGFHSSLPPSISLLCSPHQHFKTINTHIQQQQQQQLKQLEEKKCVKVNDCDKDKKGVEKGVNTKVANNTGNNNNNNIETSENDVKTQAKVEVEKKDDREKFEQEKNNVVDEKKQMKDAASENNTDNR